MMIVSLRAQELDIAKERDLNFGMTFSGIQQEIIVSLDDPGTAFFRITGPRNARIYISFVLPAHLINNNGPGTIPITFNNTSAGWNRNISVPPANNRFDPAMGTTARIHPGGGGPVGTSFVWLGGIITIDAQQPGGAYSGTATIIVERIDI
jgi:hypothetical protein